MNDNQTPVVQRRKQRLVAGQRLDEARRVLWRAFQHGSLSEDEFANALDRLEFDRRWLEPSLK